MRSVLLSGANGFMGRHIALCLLKENIQVVGLDLASDGVMKFPKYVRANLLQETLHAEIFEGVDTVIHAAAIIPGDGLGIYKEESDPNLAMTLNLLEACNRAEIKRFVQIGSASVYGSANTPRSESSNLCPISTYGKSKLASERAIIRYVENLGFSAVLLRKGSVFGEDMPASNSAARMIRSIASGRFFIPGDGHNLKSFLHVEEAANVVLASVREVAAISGFEILNAASAPVSVGAIADAAADAIGARQAKRVPLMLLKPGQFIAEHSRVSKLANLAGSIRKLSSTDILDCSRIHERLPDVIFGNALDQMAKTAVAQKQFG